jgi:capsular polysaccharide transport system permease protein
MQSTGYRSAIPEPLTPRVRRFKSLRVIAALILRELESSETRTSLGFLWAFIEPIATIALMSIVFGIISRTPPIGTNFPIFYLTGIVPFGIYSTLARKSASSLKFSKSLLNFPSVKPIDAIMARFLLNLFIEIVVFVCLAAIIIYFWDLKPTIKPALVIEALALAAALGLGMGCFNAVIFLLLPTYENFWSIISRPLMLASGILIPIDSLPEPYRTYLWWNPIAHPVEMMRAAFYAEVVPVHASSLYVGLIALTLFCIGMIMLHRHVRDAMEI